MIVYTACMGEQTDPLHEPEVIGKCGYICFTDQPIKSRVWTMVRLPKQDRPTRCARRLKASSHVLFPRQSTLWIDCCFTLLVDPHDMLEEYRGEMCATRHFMRNRIAEEGPAVLRLGKAKPETVVRQIDAYRSEGFDTVDNPQKDLTYGGILLRRPTETVRRFEKLLIEQLDTYTLRDQLSIDYCAWKTGLEIQYMRGVHNDNPYARFRHYKRPTVDF